MASEGEDLTLGPKTVSVTQNFVWILFKVKVTGKVSDTDIRRGQESARLPSLSGASYTAQLASGNR